MVSVARLRRLAYITSVTGTVGTAIATNLILRKVHKDALEYVNAQRLREGKAPVDDFPTGFRHEEGNSPIGKLISFAALDEALSTDDTDYVAKMIVGGSAESAVAWYLLFCAGFYSSYNEGRCYVKLPPSRMRRFLTTVRDKPANWQESYLRTKALISHVRHELPIRT